MSRKTTLYLPPEVVEIIAGYLAFEHPPTLISLAKASKTYYACCRPAVKSLLFHDIKLPIPDSYDEFEKTSQRLVKRLQAADSFAFVRRLFLPRKKEVRWSWMSNTAEEDAEGRDWEPPHLSDLKSSTRADTYTTQYGNWQELQAGYRPSLAVSTRTLFEDFNQPIVQLIKMLPGLTDVIWLWAGSFPTCILDTLHQDRPHCRLHVYGFSASIRYLDAERPKVFQLLKSPSLYTLVTSRSESHDLIVPYATLAPNLKVIRFKSNFFESNRPPLNPQHGLHIRDKMFALEELYFEEYGGLDTRFLRELSNYTDFSTLQTLHIPGRLEDDAFDLFDSITPCFPSLRSLHLSLAPRWGSGSTRSPEFFESAHKFIEKLPSLRELQLEGWHSMISIESIVRTHGPRLRKLELLTPIASKSLNEDEIRLLGERCPFLQDLAIPILRTEGDAEEVKLYKALGSLQDLQHLYLTYNVTAATFYDYPRESVHTSNVNNLCITTPPPENPSWDEFQNAINDPDSHCQLRNGHYMKTIIDSVIDEDLITSVFKIISDHKEQDWPPLKELTLECDGFMSDFRSKWRTIRNPYSRARKNLISEQLHSNDKNQDRYDHLDDSLLPVFYRLFPAAIPKGPPRKQSKKLAAKREKEKRATAPTWKRYLHSFPLDSTMDHPPASTSRP